MARKQVTGISARLDADTKPYINGMKRAQSQTMTTVAAMKKSFGTLNTAVSRLTGGFGALLGLGAFSSMVNSVRDLTKESTALLDALGKTAKLLGLTAEELSVYQFAATQSGLTTRQFNTSFQRFNRRISEARVGTGVLGKVLKELNITTEDSNGSLKTENALFREFADKISETTNHADRLRFSVAAFDMEGARMVNMLREGSAGLDEFTMKAKELGIVITTEMVENAKKFANELDVLEKQNKIATARLARDWGEFVLDLEAGLNKVKELILFINSGPRGPETIDEFKAAIKELNDELESGEFVRQRLWKAERLEEYREALAKLIEKQNQSVVAADEQRRATDANAKSQKEHTAALKEHETLMKSIEKFQSSRAQREEKITRDFIQSKAMVAAAESKNEQLRINLIKDQKKRLTAQANLEVDIAKRTHSRRLIGDEKYAGQSAKMEEELLEFIHLRHQQLVSDIEALDEKKVESAKKTADLIVEGPMAQLIDRWSNATEAMEFATVGWLERSADALADFVTTGKFRFKELTQSIIKDLIKIQLKQQAVSLFSSAFSAVSGNFTAAQTYNTTPFSQQTRMLASQDAAFRQAGGPVIPGKAYVVGEKGPELFASHDAGRIFRTGQGSSQTGQPKVRVNVINNGQPSEIESTSASYNMEELIVNVIMKNRRKGGVLARELGPSPLGMRGLG